MGLIFPRTKAVHEAVVAERPENNGALMSNRGNFPARSEKAVLALSHAAEDFFDIVRFLVIGAFIAALLQTLVPRQIFAAAVSPPVFSILLMMIMAVVLNLCSEADAFVAASFRSSPVPLSAQLGFMILGPMLDLKLILMYLNVFRIRAIAALAVFTFSAVFLGMILLERW